MGDPHVSKIAYVQKFTQLGTLDARVELRGSAAEPPAGDLKLIRRNAGARDSGLGRG